MKRNFAMITTKSLAQLFIMGTFAIASTLKKKGVDYMPKKSMKSLVVTLT
jgi:hypothetical protein